MTLTVGKILSLKLNLVYEMLKWKGAMYDSTVDTENGEKDVTRASRYESQGVSSKRLLSAFAGVLQDR